MNATLIEQIETNAERAASAIFAGAVGFAVYGGFGEVPLQPELGLAIGVATVIAFFLSRSALQTVAQRERRFAVRAFNVREIETIDDALLLSDAVNGELILADEDRVEPDELVLTDRVKADEQPLELNDILDELRPDARVVR